MRTITVAILAALALVTPAQATQTPEQILSDLAARQTHSWIQNNAGFPALMAAYKNGERLSVTCYYVSEIGRQLLRQAGYTARVVQTITRDEFDGFNDGHSMLEVYDQGRWNLYDVDANVRAVNVADSGISLVEQARAIRENRAMWKPIASDPLFREDEPDEFLREAVRKVFADPVGFYKRVVGSVFVPRAGDGSINQGMWYTDADQADRLRTAGITGLYLATPTIWYALTGEGAPAKVTQTPANSTHALPVAATLPAARPQRKKSCKRLRHRYRRTHTVRAKRKYLRCKRNH